MEPTLLFTFGVLTFLCIIVAVDEMLERKTVLGEEWDFTKIHFKPRSIDIYK